MKLIDRDWVAPRYWPVVDALESEYERNPERVLAGIDAMRREIDAAIGSAYADAYFRVPEFLVNRDPGDEDGET